MKIAASNLLLNSNHSATTRQEQSETLRRWNGARQTVTDLGGSRGAPLASTVARISDAARTLATSPARPAAVPAKSAEAAAIEAGKEAAEKDPFLQLIKSMVEMLTGEPVKVFSSEALTKATPDSGSSGTAANSGEAAAAARPAGGAGFEYSFRSVYEETEVSNFSATGVVRTADGAEIAFKLDLTMSRSYREETRLDVRGGVPEPQRKDPLVINFGGTAAQLSSQRFRFDLDGDGTAEELPLFTSGSGYLALDLDNNGKIDSGAELFGPRSNDGFAELARHDGDGNGWIDENDAIFEHLKVWVPAANGAGRLMSLKEAGVGAIALARAATPFELRGAGNSNLGAVRESSVWLGDDGRVGSVQEIDLTV